MVRYLSIAGLLLFSVAQIGHSENAEDSLSVDTPSIVDRINSAEPGKGKVKVIQDKAVSDRVGRPRKQAAAVNDEYVEMSGWRVQVFAGNNQRSSKEEAFKKETAIKLTFPELPTYVKYSAPFWRLRVGDFRTYKDANETLTKLKRSFPSYGREMSIIKETILVKK